MYFLAKCWLLLVTCFCILSPMHITYANDVCASHLIHQEKLTSNPNYQQHYEQFNQKIAEKTLEAYQKGQFQDKSAQVYNIPIVVHIVHSTFTAIGEGSNITDDQVYKAINQINDAFRNQGAYKEDHGVDTEIAFCLAHQTPEGTPTNGIIRYLNNEFTHLEMTQEKELLAEKVKSWDTEKYLNIWIVDEICKADYPDPCAVVAYSYTPSSVGEYFDGIVTEEQYFGVDNRRTKILIHEVGHYLNLLHTFQAGCRNNNCLEQGDLVCDTPPDNSQNFKTNCDNPENSCTTDTADGDARNPFRASKEGGLGDQDDLVENYMDYSSRACQNSFTQGQKFRMRTSLELIRHKLIQSKACVPLFIHDLAITEVITPTNFLCEDSLEINLVLHNYGNLTITNPSLLYQLDDETVMQYNWSGEILPGEELSIGLPPITVNNTGLHKLHLHAFTNVEDDNGANNNIILNFNYLQAQILPIQEDFEDNINLQQWLIANEDTDKTWEQKSVSTCEENGDRNLFLNAYNYPNTSKQKEYLYTHIDLEQYADAQLDFDVAYIPRSAEESDGLEVKISTDCGATFSTIYKRYGKYLSVEGENVFAENYWQPPSCDAWRTESVNLNDYIGHTAILAIEAFSDYGNNIYLDNINIDGRALLPCPIPQNISIQETTANSIYVAWESTENAQEYVVRLKTKEGVSWEQVLTVTGNQIDITNLLPNVDYELQIQAQCSTTRFSGFSNSIPFNISSFTCIAPSNISFQNITTKTAVIQWNEVPNANYYLINYRLQDGSEQQQQLQTNENFLQLSNLKEGEIYDIKIKTICNVNGESNFSTTSTLVLAGTCKAPQNITLNNIDTQSAEIRWEASYNATNYRLQYRKTTKLHWVLINTPETFYQLNELTPGSSYQVKVTAECSEGWLTSEIRSFQTVSDCPAIEFVNINDIGEDQARINWPTVNNEAEYEIIFQVVGSSVRHKAATFDNFYEFRGLFPCTDYIVKIQVHCTTSTNNNIYEFNFKTNCDTYCEAYANNAEKQWVETVTINDWSFTSQNDNGYADFSNNLINVTRGAVLQVELKAGKVARGNVPYWNVWIDWNQNKYFEPSENVLIVDKSQDQILVDNPFVKPKNIEEGVIFVPADAPLGTTRMRVIFQDKEQNDPCAILDNGEVEDYTIQVNAPSLGKKEANNNIHTWNFNLTPNPAKDQVQVHIQNANNTTDFKVAVFDINGRLIMPQQTLSNNQIVDISSLSKGLYFMQVQTPTELKVQKLMVW